MSLLRATSRSGLRSTERTPQFGTPIVDIDATDQALAVRLRFSGSPTIRIDGRDVDPESVDARLGAACTGRARDCAASPNVSGSRLPFDAARESNSLAWHQAESDRSAQTD